MEGLPDPIVRAYHNKKLPASCSVFFLVDMKRLTGAFWVLVFHLYQGYVPEIPVRLLLRKIS